MDLENSVTLWIDRLRQGDQDSAQQLWQRYYEQLVRLAGTKLPRGARRAFDEEDVALSAFHSLCVGIQEGRFPKLDDRDNLWSLLVVLTARKAIRRMRAATAKKRGGGGIQGETAFLRSSPGEDESQAGINQVIGNEPSAEFAAEVVEESEKLFSVLPDDEMRELARLKMEGYSNQEAATQLDCGLRTIERRLALIRKIWEAKA